MIDGAGAQIFSLTYSDSKFSSTQIPTAPVFREMLHISEAGKVAMQEWQHNRELENMNSVNTHYVLLTYSF